jgi:methylmalonyl-CoA mutase C-terminal domain/subunit
VSYLDGGHVGWTKDLLAALRERDGADLPVIVGGIIPEDDLETLRELGVADVAPPGTPLEEVVAMFFKAGNRQSRVNRLDKPTAQSPR